MSGPQTFCERLAEFLQRFRYSNDMIIYEDRNGIFGRGQPIGLLVSNRRVEVKDFDRARRKGLKVVCENTSFGLKCYKVPNHAISHLDIPRLIHCQGPPLYERRW